MGGAKPGHRAPVTEQLVPGAMSPGWEAACATALFQAKLPLTLPSPVRCPLPTGVTWPCRPAKARGGLSLHWSPLCSFTKRDKGSLRGRQSQRAVADNAMHCVYTEVQPPLQRMERALEAAPSGDSRGAWAGLVLSSCSVHVLTLHAFHHCPGPFKYFCCISANFCSTKKYLFCL